LSSVYSIVRPLALLPAVGGIIDALFAYKKLQCNVGRCKAMKYFMQDNVKRLTWLVPLFVNDSKGKEGG
jgi:hypothetical protein